MTGGEKGLHCTMKYTQTEGPPCEKGDVDGDRQINVNDVLIVVNHIIGTIEITDTQALWRADCNGDGNIDSLDIVGIINTILGKGNCEP